MKTTTAFMIVTFIILGLAACSEYSNTLTGDLNGDGHLTAADIELLGELIAEGNGHSNADIDGDSDVHGDDLDELKDLVCQENGGTMKDGECCVVDEDGTTCCDLNFDGDFGDCTQDTDCIDDQDCDILNCPAYCTEAGKCRCIDMCDEDEDCIALNCPAFCNDHGQCECKVPCEDDDDCAFISKCRSVCSDEGFCVCEDGCIGEGEGFEGDPEQHDCCAGLVPIELAAYNAGRCDYVDCLCFVCTACGDGECGIGENPCNCQEDCGECEPGDTLPYRCQNTNQQVPWCTCNDDRTWDCILSPENQCRKECHQAGEHFIDYEGTEVCCEGLTRADDCVPDVVNGEVTCACFDCPCFVCVECGDDVCGAGENFCTCAEDCPLPECTPGATLPCGCQNNLAETPPCWTCDENGAWQPIDYTTDPCLCQASSDCSEGFVCELNSGQCLPDCRLFDCEPGTDCNICGEFQVCHPDTGLCVGDCRYLDFACPEGERCDEDLGICVPVCLGEGERFEDFNTEGKCCEGLVAIPDHFPENGHCVGPNCPCFICTRCGTDDGVCSLGENRCNCPEDCVGAGACQAEECVTVQGDYAVSGDCPGIVSGDFEMYRISQAECELTFHDLLEDLLGPTGCIDHDIIFTARRCEGVVTVTGVSRTMYFTCPFDNADQTQDTCHVFLDDLID